MCLQTATATTDYFDIKEGDTVVIVERVTEVDGEKISLPFSKTVLESAYNPDTKYKGKQHYMFDFEIENHKHADVDVTLMSTMK